MPLRHTPGRPDQSTPILERDTYRLRARIHSGQQADADALGPNALLATREQAVAIAAECPAAQWSTVEIRGVGPCYE